MHVDNSQITPLLENTTAGVVADASKVDPAILALQVAINTNDDEFTAFKTALELPIPDQSIVTRHLRNLAVTNPKLAPLAVTADKIADGSITLAKLADLVVTAAKIANGTITEAKMANSSVSRRMIQAGAVGANEIDPTILAPITDAAVQVKFNQIDEQLAERAIYISSSNKGTDIADILQTALDDPEYGIVHIPAGEYLLSKSITIPKDKQVIMTGNNGSNYLTNTEVDETVFTKLKPTFNGDFVIKLKDRTTLENGFINCESMTSGGGILLDCSRERISGVNVKGTLLSGGNNWSLDGVRINADRPAGTLPGFAYFLTIDAGIQGFGKGIHLKRTDTYTSNGTGTNGIVWVIGIKVYGNMMKCQRYVHFNTVINDFAGGSSVISCRLQGGDVPDKSIPAVELGGDDQILNCQFHDINTGEVFYQNVRYKLGGTTNAIIMKGYKGDSSIIDWGTDTTYVQHYSKSGNISTLDDGTALDDGWFVRTDNVVTVNFIIPNLTQKTTWTPILTLPYPSAKQVRVYAFTDQNNKVNVLIQGNQLSVINNNTGTQYSTVIQITYPV